MLKNSKSRPRILKQECSVAQDNEIAQTSTSTRESPTNGNLTPSDADNERSLSNSEMKAGEFTSDNISRREAFGKAKKEFGQGLVKLLRTCNLLEQELKDKFIKS